MTSSCFPCYQATRPRYNRTALYMLYRFEADVLISGEILQKQKWLLVSITMLINPFYTELFKSLWILPMCLHKFLTVHHGKVKWSMPVALRLVFILVPPHSLQETHFDDRIALVQICGYPIVNYREFSAANLALAGFLLTNALGESMPSRY